ncbi:MAG TPA: DUF342 domain-containing protein [Desulfonatronum sp.]|nr:DUF342 domain-containing protein [Desulfonatronum sp.]
MAFFLKHHFDPDFNHLDIKAKVGQGDRVDHLNRDYVHNVVAGEVLAEWIEVPEEMEGAYDPRFLFDHKTFPIGPNCLVDPTNQDRFLAGVNGYVYYDLDRKIAVKTLLNIRCDVDYATGNISFVGDIVVHGAIRSGFSVKGRNILVNGPVEGAAVEASGAMQIDAGVRGDNRAEIRANGSIKLKFCENALVSAGKNVFVQGSAMHCKIYAGNALAVGEKLIGGQVVCRRMVHVGEQLGGGLSTVTNIVLGYDPFLLHKMSEIEGRIEALQRERPRMAAQAAKKLPNADQRFKDLEHEVDLFQKQLTILSGKLAAEDVSTCAVVAPGEVRPGVEVSIGQLFHSIADFLRNVRIRCKNNQIAVESPAEPGK